MNIREILNLDYLQYHGISREVPVQHNTLSRVKHGHLNLAKWHHEPFRKSVRRRAEKLQRAKPTKMSLLTAIKSADINLSAVARRLGKSRQAVEQTFTENWVSQRKINELHTLVLQIGDELMRATNSKEHR